MELRRPRLLASVVLGALVVTGVYNVSPLGSGALPDYDRQGRFRRLTAAESAPDGLGTFDRTEVPRRDRIFLALREAAPGATLVTYEASLLPLRYTEWGFVLDKAKWRQARRARPPEAFLDPYRAESLGDVDVRVEDYDPRIPHLPDDVCFQSDSLAGVTWSLVCPDGPGATLRVLSAGRDVVVVPDE